jgi:hypothetical protein
MNYVFTIFSVCLSAAGFLFSRLAELGAVLSYKYPSLSSSDRLILRPAVVYLCAVFSRLVFISVAVGVYWTLQLFKGTQFYRIFTHFSLISYKIFLSKTAVFILLREIFISNCYSERDSTKDGYGWDM